MDKEVDTYALLIFVLYILWAVFFLLCCMELGGTSGLLIGISGLMLSFTNSVIASLLIKLERSYEQ